MPAEQDEEDSFSLSIPVKDKFYPESRIEDLYCKVLIEREHEEWITNLSEYVRRVGRNYLAEDDPRLAFAVIQTIQGNPCLNAIRRFLVKQNIRPEIVYEYDMETPTGIRILAVGSSIPVNWIPSLLEDAKTITNILSHCRLQMVQDGRSAVILPKEKVPVPAPPPSPRF